MQTAVLVLAGLTALATAQMKPNMKTGGEVCLASMFSDESVMNLMYVGESLKGCFRDVKLSTKQLKTIKDCQVNEKMKTAMMNKNRKMSDIMDVMKTNIKCMLGDMRLLTGSNNINHANAASEFDNLLGPQQKIDFLKKSYNKCSTDVENKHSSLSATDKYMRIHSCMGKEAYEYCVDMRDDPGPLAMLVAMESLFQEPKCQGVNITCRFMPVMKCKMMAMMSSMKIDPKKFKAMSKFDRDDKAKMMMSANAFMKILGSVLVSVGLIDSETGAINYEVGKTLLVSADGWRDNQEELEQILSDIDYCARLAPFEDPVDVEGFVKILPFIPIMPPTMYQMYRFNQCFLPRLGGSCGLMNEVGITFQPFLAFMLPKEDLNAIYGRDVDQIKDEIMDEIINARPEDLGCTDMA